MQLGFLINSLVGQDALITNLNKLTEENDVKPLVFYQTQKPCGVRPLFCMLNHNEAFSFRGPLITVSANNFQLMMNSYSSTARYLMVSQPEWATQQNYERNSFTFANKNVNYLSINTGIQSLLLKVWNTKSTIIENWNYEQIRNLCKSIYGR